ncbi:MAG: HAD-IIIC family phosphatase, partial [Bacteroidetes bacterium]|nr:HAD-IIIC family phosphatase [Bacteroidota bacterium]
MKILETKVESIRNIKLALLGDSATQFFTKALKTIAAKENLALDIYESEYDQVERQILDTNSAFYKFNPTVVIVFNCTNKLLEKFYSTNEQDKNKFSDNYLKFANTANELINENLNCRTIFLNFNEYDNREYGNYASKINTSFLFQLRQINMGLMYLAEAKKNLLICDISYLVAQVGNKVAVDEKFYINSSLAFHPTFYSIIAKNIIDIINASVGKFKKCLILDLDNTLWGGIIGDDGLEKIQIGDYKIGKAFSLVQQWAKQLKERGIILAICSKNTESIAKEPFEKHPEMVLRLSDIAVFQANWETKVDNIRHIQEILNIGFDSMVFLDDNPFERNIVIQNIPEITVPDLPEDPSLYLSYLRQLNLFETASVSEADKARTEQYQIEATRKQFQKSFQNETEYLVSLDMQCDVASFNSFNLPRVAQLTQRSNQFN